MSWFPRSAQSDRIAMTGDHAVARSFGQTAGHRRTLRDRISGAVKSCSTCPPGPGRANP